MKGSDHLNPVAMAATKPVNRSGSYDQFPVLAKTANEQQKIVHVRKMRLLVRNQIAVVKSMPAELRHEGENWYGDKLDQVTNDFKSSGRKNRGGLDSEDTAAGVTAALSPQRKWEVNANLSARSFRLGHGVGHFSQQTEKATRILEGEHPLEVLTGPKERPFYQHLRSRGMDNSIPAPIDRQHHDLAMGQPFGDKDRGLKGGRVAHFQDAAERAANTLGYTTGVGQSTAWVGWRGTGA